MHPGRVLILGARATLALAVAAVLTLLLGPFQGAERYFLLTDKQAHTIAFFVLTSVALPAFPRIRRNELALTALALGICSEAAQAVVGRDGSVGDALADGAGVLMAIAPTYVQRLRALARGDSRPRRRRGDRLRTAAGTATRRSERIPRAPVAPPLPADPRA